MKKYLLVASLIFAFVALMILLSSVFYILLTLIVANLPVLKENGMIINILDRSCMLIGVCISSFVLMRYWEHTPFSDLGLAVKGRAKDILWGTLVAAILYIAGFGISLLLGVIEVTGMHFDAESLCLSWILMLLVAVSEEIAMRGFVLGRLLNAGVGRYWALFISSLLFSLMHLFNPNFTFLPFLNILLAGCLLGASYIYTRNLWFPIALHLFWNWIQGPLLGYQVSGGNFGDTLLTLHLPEENIINGGAFGFEGSIICTVLIIIGTALIIKYYNRKEICNEKFRDSLHTSHS